MPDTTKTRNLESVLRSLATAARSLRLYPASSPIPLQSVQAVRTALEEYFGSGSDVLRIALARDGFSVDGEVIGAQIPGTRDLSDELRAHGVAEIEVASEVTGDELLTFLTIVSRPVDEVRAEGGIAALADANGVDNLRISQVRLAVLEQDAGAADADEYLLDLAQDSGALAEWFAAAAAGDPAKLEADLVGLIHAVDPDDEPRMVRSLGQAFKSQPPAAQDALLGLAMKPGPVRSLVGDLFANFEAAEIAGSILSGAFGKNMLALSNALTHLPLDEIAAEVRAEIESMLPRAGHTPHEAAFLDHMVRVRKEFELERPLVTTDRTYSAVATAASLSDEDVARAREAVTRSRREIGAAGARAMLALLDEQTDFERYCGCAENLAGTVSHTIEQGDLKLASHVIEELVNRQSRSAESWPELSARLDAAIRIAAGPRSMGALVRAVVANPALSEDAASIVHFAGESGGPALVAEAIILKDEGIAAAEQLLGRRIVDLLNTLAPETSWHLLGPVVRRLAAEGDARSVSTIESLMERPDEQSPREVVTALAGIRQPLSTRLLADALRDPRRETVSIAARAIARSGEPGSAELLAARLDELDMDRADFPLAKELIGALARTPEPAADDVLDRLGSRRAFIKRGHFADIQALVAEARRARRAGIA